MLRAGEAFGRYQIESVLGRGGMGVVYRALDPALDRRVALKVLAEASASDDGKARLLREARAAAALDHPNSVSIFEVGEVDGAPYLTMELVSGRTLREALADAPAPMAERIGWLTDAARALAAAHARGLVHRDVKPENVMVRGDGVVKVLDFGIARRAAGAADPTASTESPALPTLTREGVRVGTPIYMAPEQVRGGAIDGRADQFAWGVLAYELCAGRLPWRGGGDPLAVMASALTDDPDPGPLLAAGVPEHVPAVILRALEKRADQRFASMDELVAALAGGAAPRAPKRPGAEAGAASSPISAPTSARRYATGEVRAILSRAVELQAARRADTRLSMRDLVAAAREVGVDEATLREASRDLSEGPADNESTRAADLWLARKRRSFTRHLAVWIAFNAAMLVVGILRNKLPQIFVPGVFWAIPLAFQGIMARTATRDDWPGRARRDRHVPLPPAVVPSADVDEAAVRILETGELRARRRIAVPTQQAADEDSELAEQEAAPHPARRRARSGAE